MIRITWQDGKENCKISKGALPIMVAGLQPFQEF